MVDLFDVDDVFSQPIDLVNSNDYNLGEIVSAKDRKDVERVLISEENIRKRVRGLAHEIAKNHEGETLYCLGLMDGAAIFLSELARELTRYNVTIVYSHLDVSKYTRTGNDSHDFAKDVKIHYNENKMPDIHGKNILIVEDMIDKGTTLKEVVKFVASEFKPKKLEVCVFYEKILENPTKEELKMKKELFEAYKIYIGVRGPDVWVVGYGMDAKDQCRTLPYIAEFKK